MKRGRLPLTALRSFEVAGRLQSFTLAAEGLHISQAAISRQVRELESRLGQPLFERHHRSVLLTPAGKTLLSVLTTTFDAIAISLDSIGESSRSLSLTVSAEPSFASALAGPSHVSVSEKISEYRHRIGRRSAIGRIPNWRGRYSYPTQCVQNRLARVESRRLVASNMIPVAGPSLIAASLLISAES